MRPLRHFPLFRSSNIDEAQQLIAQHVKPHSIQIAGAESSLNVDFSGLELQGVSLFHVFYGAKVQVNPEQNSCSFFIQSTLSGEGEVIHQGKKYHTHDHDTVVASPSTNYSMVLQENCSRLAIEIDRDILQSHLASVMACDLDQELVFDLHCESSQQSWQNTIRYVLQQADFAPELLGKAPMKKALSELLLSQLLETQPHNYSEQMRRDGELMLPNHLRHAVDFIQANICNPPSMAELAKHCNTSVRTLQRSFIRCLNKTPVEYIRDLRLRAVHKTLQEKSSQENGALTRILLDHGITDLGRFASYYRKKFGCKPSETLNS